MVGPCRERSPLLTPTASPGPEPLSPALPWWDVALKCLPGRAALAVCHRSVTAGTAPTAPQAAQPQGGTVSAATVAQDKGTDEPGGGKTEPEQETGLAAPEPQDGHGAVLGEEASAVQHDGGQAAPDEGQAASTGQKVPAATEAQGVGKDEKDKPGKKKAPAAGDLKGEKASDEPKEGKGLAVTEAQDGGKDKPKKEEVPGGSGAEGGGKAESTEEKAPAAANSEGGKAKPVEETALAAAQAQDGGKGEPAKEKITGVAKEEVPATAKALDEGKQDAKAEQAPADTKPAKEKTVAAGKEKAPNAAKAQSGENKMVKAEKAPAVKKASDGDKEKPTKEKAPAPVKEKTPAPVKEKTPASVKEKAIIPAKEKGPGAAKAQGGEKTAGTEEQPPTIPEPPRPALLQSLSCPAACHREVQPWAEMEAIEEETMMVEPKEGPTEPGSGPPALGDQQPLEPAGTPQERTLPSATGQPPDPAGVAEQPGPGVQSSLTEANSPQSPYLTADFGKEDAFEILDDVPPPPAPFAHRTVTLRSASVSSQFSLNSKDILGGGKFGEVHTCTEKETGLKLAAKVIRKQGAKDKEMVLLEIDVMNQLNHHNLIQLYDAIETPREIILFMEFVEGGELFERIIDDDYHLTEVDCMVFVRQICEGIRFMHHMCVLHLDLKPENILCVSATGHMVKIIDFGLARRYNPNEKLKVNFGTPEFLSPEVVNYEQVSYSTDMWSMGVITYMLLSGLSPFLGDDDTETLNNVLAANWYFDEETFESVSDEAKDFVSNLIIKDKSARMSADQCLQHPWLNNLAEKAKRSNRRLKSQVLLKKYVMRRRWKKNFIGVCAANRFRKITSSGSLTALGI
uniref:Myosin light chain kinase 2, skeletal/cardiac muscle n=1 Tax=Cyanoderma ruficeps TaxID=181631 RepID=A0A8C3QT29_9PASS